MNRPEPIDWKGYIRLAPDNAGLEPAYTLAATFRTEQAARQWVEEARSTCPDPGNFACSVIPVFHH